MAMSLQSYYDSIVWLNLSVFILYFLIKYVPLSVYTMYLLVQLFKKCKQRNSPPTPNQEGEQNNSSPTSNQEEAPTLPCLVLLVFGKQLGTKYATKKHKIYITDMECSPRIWQLAVFIIIILESTLLALGSALDLTLFEVTHVCTEDPYIDCFPQLINKDNQTNLTISVDRPIQDCSFWNSESILETVTFVCFQRYFNLEMFLGIAGGLVAFALIVLKTTIGLLIWLTRLCIRKSGKSTGCTCTYITHWIFIGVALVIEAVVVVLQLVLGVTKISADGTSDTPESVFLTMHNSEILVVVGTVATLLWLPWEQYVKHQREEEAKHKPQEMRNPCSK